MLTRRLLLAAPALACALAAGTVRAQFAPPGPSTPASTNPGASAASPGGGGLLNISPPATIPGAISPTTPVASTDNGPLKPLRANVYMTTNALIGFVNDTPFFLDDIFRPIDADLRLLAAHAKSIGEFRDGAAALIGNQIREQESEGLEVTAQEARLTDEDRQRINVFLALQRHNLLAKFGGSIPAADRTLAATGSSVDKAMADQRRQAIKDLYFSKNLLPRIVVTRQMELDAYEKDPKRWQQPATLEMYTLTLDITRWLREPTTNGKRGNILANPTPEQIKSAEHEALTLAYEIESKLRAGADFAVLVENYESDDDARSNGGRTPSLVRGSKSDAKFEEFVFSLPANTLADPQLMRQPDFRGTSVVIVRTGKKTDARTVPFTEAQAELALDLKKLQLRELQIQDMEKLSKGAAIEAIDRMLPVAVDAAVTRYATGTSR